MKTENLSLEQLQQKAMAEAVETACNNMYGFALNIGNPTCKRKLPEEIKRKAMKEFSERKLIDIDGNEVDIRKLLDMDIFLFGTRHSLLNKLVKKPRGRLRNWGYQFPKGPDAQRIGTIDQFDEIFIDSKELVKECMDGLDEFMRHYDEHVAAGRRENDLIFEKIGIKLSQVSDNKGRPFLNFPTADEFRAKFYCEISDEPILLDSDAFNRFGHVMPSDMALKMQSNRVAKVYAVAQAAKGDMIKLAEKFIQRLVKATRPEAERFRDEIITDSLDMAQRLETMAKSFDQDEWLLQAAKVIREQVEGLSDVNAWREDKAARGVAHRAFKGISGKLESVHKSQTAKPEPTTAPPVNPTENTAQTDDGGFSGLMADMI